MELSIDKFGRIVIPKKLRDSLCVRNGLMVEVLDTPDGLLLKPVRQPTALVRKHGILVHQGRPSPGIDWSSLVEEEREERLKKIARP